MRKLILPITLTSLILLAACEAPEPEPEPVNNPPVASIKASPTEGEEPLRVEFDASLSSDPDDDILTYSWDFGNGKTSKSVAPSSTYQDAGTFTARLTVSDEEGLSDSAQVSIKVNEPPDLFPIVENAQWVYYVESTETENGNVSDFESGYLYLTVEKLDLTSEYSDFMTLRVTGKRYYNKKAIVIGDRIYLSHVAGSHLKVLHDGEDGYSTYIDVGTGSYSNFNMFFSQFSRQSVTLTTMDISIGLGTYPAFRVRYHRDNWGEQYITERYDVTDTEFLNPQIGFLYRETSSYVNFLDCFYCPVYGGGDKIELVGYYIPQPDGTALQGGSRINPDNPYGGNLGILTIWASEDIGFTEVFIDGDFVGTITNYWPDGLQCGQVRAVNASFPDGSYTLTAESNKGYYWEGVVVFTEGVCDTVELTLSKKGFSTSRKIHLSGGSE